MALLLVVDDDAAIAEVVRLALTDEGHAVLRAPTGDAALALARAHRPLLVISDLWMPGGMSGMGLLRALREAPETAAVRILAVSALGPRSREVAITAGADAFLPKPFDLDALLAAVAALLAGGGAP